MSDRRGVVQGNRRTIAPVRSIVFALALAPAFALAQGIPSDAKVTCRQRTNAATGARDVMCENARATAFVSDVARGERAPRFRQDGVVAAPPIGVTSVTDIATTRAAAVASRLRRNPSR